MKDFNATISTNIVELEKVYCCYVTSAEIT